MEKEFSSSWISSKKPRKQRKFRFNAPLHIKQKFARAHLSKELRKKHNKRNVGLKKGDKIKVMRGQFKKHTGKVQSIDLKNSNAIIEGIEVQKKDGTKTTRGIHISNLMIIELNLEDKKRQKTIGRKTK